MFPFFFMVSVNTLFSLPALWVSRIFLVWCSSLVLGCMHNISCHPSLMSPIYSITAENLGIKNCIAIEMWFWPFKNKKKVLTSVPVLSEVFSLPLRSLRSPPVFQNGIWPPQPIIGASNHMITLQYMMMSQHVTTDAPDRPPRSHAIPNYRKWMKRTAREVRRPLAAVALEWR